MYYIFRARKPLHPKNNYSTYFSTNPQPPSPPPTSISHSQSIKQGTILDIYTANNILSSYTKCKDLFSAHNLFDEMPQRDTVTYNTLLTAHVNVGNHDTAIRFMKMMNIDGFNCDQYTFGSVLKGIACMGSVVLGEEVHAVIVKTGYERDVFAGSALLDMYCKCGRIRDGCKVFDCMPERNSVSWNALIGGFAQVGDRGNAFGLLGRMEREGVSPDDGTFASLLTLLDEPRYYKLTMQIHAKIIKFNRVYDITASNATITAYSECGSVEDSERVFGNVVGMRDLVTWNSMLAAYVVRNQGNLGFKLFIGMQRIGFEGDLYTYTSVISASVEPDHRKQGMSLHGMVIKKGFEQATPVCNSLISMYLKVNSNCMLDALKLFNCMEFKDSVSWNSILTGFSQKGLSEDALRFFAWMRSIPLGIDQYAFSVVLRSCSDLAALQLGQQVHVLALKSGVVSNDFVASSLIFMYSKCGIIEDARQSFEETPKDDAITWNSVMFGYAQHGEGKTALDLFSQMQETKVNPDHITFVAVLTACSHIGLVEQGSAFLNSMKTDYGIPPRMEHYACAVDLFGRAGRLNEAKQLVESMPFEPDAMVLKTLLGACRIKGDIHLASEIAKHLLVLEPEEHCTYVLLSSMYGGLGKWDESANIKKVMRERGVKKVPGWSWVEVKNEVHAFNAEDRVHPQCEEIYRNLRFLSDEINWISGLTNVDLRICCFNDDDDDEDKDSD
ncbi:hypothetical protein ACHQM5_006811 [Ranunculus cassubicifolius]